MKKLIAAALAFFMLLAAAGACGEVTLEEALGVTEGDEYRNEFLGFGFRCEGWQYTSREELMSFQENAKSRLSQDAKKAIEEAGSVPLMMAFSPNGVDNVSMNMTFLGEEAAIYELLGMKTIYESQAEQIRDYIGSAGIALTAIEISSVIIDGREMVCYHAEYSLGGGSLYAVQTSFVKDQYLVNFNATALTLEAAEDAIRCVFWME